MKCILLCAGYATRLFPLTKNFPKALLKVGPKTILDYIVDDLDKVDEIDDIYIITNNKYYSHFLEYTKNKKNISKEITVINDGTTSNSDRLGAIGDIIYTLKTQNIDDDILVMASDNLYTFAIKEFIDFYNKTSCSCVALKTSYDLEELRRFAVTNIDSNNTIIDFTEKPKNPKYNYAACALYIYKKEHLPYFDKYIAEGNNKDAPGNFVAYLYKKENVKGFVFNGECYDIGTHESLKEMNEKFS